jgi:AP-3 complex subunit beta
VLAVASLFHYLAPPSEAAKVAKAIVRLIRSKREIQYIILTNIATMAATEPVPLLFFLLISLDDV